MEPVAEVSSDVVVTGRSAVDNGRFRTTLARITVTQLSGTGSPITIREVRLSPSRALVRAIVEVVPDRAAVNKSFACAAGALAVTRLGPMEGAPTRAEVEALLRNGK